MKALDKTLRRQLESTVIKARDVAEIAAEAALKQLTVGDKAAGSHLLGDQRKLRNRLRAHGRLVGDIRSDKGEQSIYKLTTEVAYEHWHRMLFARFLAENHLLMYSDGETPLSLEDCNELAQDPDESQGASNGWELAGIYAANMLPQIFRPSSPVFELKFAPEHQRKLEQLLARLDEAVFQASDSLGWVYQFWQSKKKEQVNQSEVKIGADELPAVTQLFTEPYMVHFLLDNSLGAWWVSNYPDHKHVVALEYLRTLEDGKPAAGEFESWPKQLEALKVLDPSCGSGHFLVAAFLMLVPMRMAAEQLSAQQAIDKVLAENIHGLELDQRCVELAAFALALTAWRYPDASGEPIGYRTLPELQLACSGQGINTSLNDWKALAEGDTKLEHGLEQLYHLFRDAPTLGSLINPHRVLGNDLVSVGWAEIQPLLDKALGSETSEDQQELGIVAQGVTKAAALLSQKYQLLITNPPYLGERKQAITTRQHSQKHYDFGKADLATTFILRGEDFTNNSTQCLVVPQNWLYQRSYVNLRREILAKKRIRLISQLGANAFESQVGADVLLIVLSSGSDAFMGLDVTGDDYDTPLKKSNAMKTDIFSCISSKSLEKHSDSRIVLESRDDSLELLDVRASSFAGILNGDTPRFVSNYWEVKPDGSTWEFLQRSVSDSTKWGGRSHAILWERGSGQLRKLAIELKERLHDADRRGNQAWGKKGIVVSQMGELPVTLYSGDLYDQSAAVIMPHDERNLKAIWVYCSSEIFSNEVRKIDKKKNVTNATLVKIPFDLEHWQKVAAKKYPNGLPKPYSSDPTQWIFHGHPAKAEDVLQVAVARLLGYRWPAELDDEMELSDEARALVNSCKALNHYADDDGIVCIPPVRGEKSAADRLNELLLAADTAPGAKLLEQAKCKGKTLEFWLREKFFEQHCKLFHHRPFIWQLWDGQKDGFSALVNYHKLTKKTMETLVYTYLGDWIRTQEQQANDGVDGADIRLQAARNLEVKLKAIIEGEAPLDIFVRWKPLAQQPIGWHPDLNDGVRLNIRPFMLCGDVGKKGAGILRAKPNIHWKKDRGKDVASAPWFEAFGGDRINDHHLTLAEKQAVKH